VKTPGPPAKVTIVSQDGLMMTYSAAHCRMPLNAETSGAGRSDTGLASTKWREALCAATAGSAVSVAVSKPATLTAEPAVAAHNASLHFVLAKPVSLRPAPEVSAFKGILQCAAEYVIISPSCDTIVTFAGGPGVFTDTSSFDLGVRRNWSAVVVDVKFDPGASPGLDGLRLVVRGVDDPNKLDSYQQFGRFTDAKPFTAILQPGATYDEGVGRVPANTTAFRFEVYPQSFGWHTVCDPAVTHDCFLGVGAGLDVKFDLYVSVFYNQPVPEGYSLLGKAPRRARKA